MHICVFSRNVYMNSGEVTMVAIDSVNSLMVLLVKYSK
jgi:hypothetical protein